MIEQIAYFLGKKEKCVICIKELPSQASIDGEIVSLSRFLLVYTTIVLSFFLQDILTMFC
jgi:hypothetical protein